MTIEVRFHTTGVSADNIIVVVENGLGASTVNTLSITRPGSVALTISPITGATATFSVPIPLDSDDNYLYGTYTLGLTANDPDDSGVEYNETTTFNFQDLSGELSIEAYADIFIKKIVVKDNTEYPDGTVDKSLVVVSPKITGETNVADITLTDTGSVTMVRSSGVAYNNVTYRVLPSATLETSIIDEDWDLGGVYAYTGDDIEVKVLDDDCGLLDCVHTKLVEIDDAACVSGGFTALPTGTKELYSKLQMYLSMYNNAKTCRDAEKTTYYRAKIESLVGTCNCVVSDTIPENNTVYLNGKSAYDLWLEEGNTGSIDDFLNTLNPVGNWELVPEADFDPDFETDPDDPLRYRVTRDGIQFAGKFIRVAASDPTSPFIVLLSTFDPGNVVLEAPIPVYSDSYRTVGSFCKQSTTWVMYADVTLAGNPSRIVSGKIPWEGVLTSLDYSFERTFTPFTNAQISGNPNVSLSWAKDANFLYIKGTWIANTTPGSGGGLELINSSVFTTIGVAPKTGFYATIYATQGPNEFENIGYAVFDGGITLFNQNTTTYSSWTDDYPSFSMQIPL
jgi:hypothetical protein